MTNLRKYSHIVSIVFLLGAFGTASAVEWPPVLNTNSDVQPPKWDWQLKSPVQLNDDPTIEIYDIDMFDNETTGMVAELQSYGKKVICYVNVGAWEDFRDDESDFPPSILGNVYDRFPNEKWLDIRDVNPAKSNTGTALTGILEARFDRAKQIGCDAVEPDNMDGFDNSSHNPSGFPLTYEDQIFFNQWVSSQVRARGMAVGFKNNTNQALDQRMIEAFDFVVTESCVLFNECQYFSGFLAAGKPVFLTEYLMTPEEFCPTAKDLRLSGIQKRFSLDNFRLNCDDYYDSEVNPDPEPEPNPPVNNLLTNGGFESGLRGWESCGAANNLSLSSNSSEGINALAISGDAGCLYQVLPVNTGEEHTLSCEARRPGTPWSIVQLSYLDSQYNSLSTEIEQISTGGSYKSYTLDGTAPTNTRYAVAVLYSEDQMLVDNCVLSNATQPEPNPEPEPEPNPQPEPEPEPEPEPNPPTNNLLTNGGFESNLLSWQSCGNPDNLSIVSNTSQGVKALALSGGAGCLYQEVPADAGTNYTLSCDATRPGNAWSIVQLSYLDAQYNDLRTEVLQMKTGGTYSSHRLQGMAPSNTAKALVLLYSEDQALVDNCVLTNG